MENYMGNFLSTMNIDDKGNVTSPSFRLDRQDHTKAVGESVFDLTMATPTGCVFADKATVKGVVFFDAKLDHYGHIYFLAIRDDSKDAFIWEGSGSLTPDDVSNSYEVNYVPFPS